MVNKREGTHTKKHTTPDGWIIKWFIYLGPSKPETWRTRARTTYCKMSVEFVFTTFSFYWRLKWLKDDVNMELGWKEWNKITDGCVNKKEFTYQKPNENWCEKKIYELFINDKPNRNDVAHHLNYKEMRKTKGKTVANFKKKKNKRKYRRAKKRIARGNKTKSCLCDKWILSFEVIRWHEKFCTQLSAKDITFVLFCKRRAQIMIKMANFCVCFIFLNHFHLYLFFLFT